MERLRETLASNEARFGRRHAETLSAVTCLAQCLEEAGKLKEAEPLYRRALAGQVAQLGSTDPLSLRATRDLACLLEEQGNIDEAEALCWQGSATKEVSHRKAFKMFAIKFNDNALYYLFLCACGLKHVFARLFSGRVWMVRTVRLSINLLFAIGVDQAVESASLSRSRLLIVARSRCVGWQIFQGECPHSNPNLPPPSPPPNQAWQGVKLSWGQCIQTL